MFEIGILKMYPAAGQFVKYEANESISKRSAFRLMIENVEELKSFTSKKVQFLDSDDVW